MLKDLEILTLELDPICKMIAGINGVDLSNENYFEHYTTGVYRQDGYIFNFDNFIMNNCNNTIVDEWVDYGVCDNYQQILEKRADILNTPNKNYVIGISTVEKKNQDPEGGWRWHKWGEYIGDHEIKHEYLYDEEYIDKVYCYHIYEIE